MNTIAVPEHLHSTHVRTIPHRPQRMRISALVLALGFLLFAAITVSASAQGCSQCTQAVGQTPPQTQAAYRKGIVLLVLAGGGVFASAVIVLRRFR